MNESTAERLLFTGDYYDYEMCCFKKEMSVSEKLIDSNACYPLSFLLELLLP